jgi:hypothetical protein
MELIQLPGDEEIGIAYDEGKEAVIALFHHYPPFISLPA